PRYNCEATRGVRRRGPGTAARPGAGRDAALARPLRAHLHLLCHGPHAAGSAARGSRLARASVVPLVSSGRTDGSGRGGAVASGRRGVGGERAGELAEGHRRRTARRGEGAVSQQINLYSPLFRKQKKLLSAMTLLQASERVVPGVGALYCYLS